MQSRGVLQEGEPRWSFISHCLLCHRRERIRWISLSRLLAWTLRYAGGSARVTLAERLRFDTGGKLGISAPPLLLNTFGFEFTHVCVRTFEMLDAFAAASIALPHPKRFYPDLPGGFVPYRVRFVPRPYGVYTKYIYIYIYTGSNS